MSKDNFKNTKEIFGIVDSMIGNAFSLGGGILTILFVVVFPLAILARCGIIPGSVGP